MEAVGHSEVLRLLAKRNIDIGNQRSRVVRLMHSQLAELAGGGIAKEINTSDVDGFLGTFHPATPVARVRYELAVELLDDIRRLDSQLQVSHKRIRDAVRASGTSLTDLFGVGPIIAAMLVGYTGDIARFANRDRYAAYNGTAPVGFSSDGRVVHRSPSAGTANSTTRSTWLRSVSSARRIPRDARTSIAGVAEGKTKKEALRALKRHASNAIYRQLVADARRVRG